LEEDNHLVGRSFLSSTSRISPISFSLTTIDSRLAAMSAAHRAKELENPIKRLDSQSAALIVKRSVQNAATGTQLIAKHSLRAGLATAIVAAGVIERAIQATIGHKSTAMLRRYIREGSLVRKNAAAAVGL
jgi:site-specific recombinase XerD